MAVAAGAVVRVVRAAVVDVLARRLQAVVVRAAAGLRGRAGVAGVVRRGRRHVAGRPSAEKPWGRHGRPSRVYSCGKLRALTIENAHGNPCRNPGG